MAWIDVEEPFAAAPVAAGVLAAPDGSGMIDLDDRWGSISGAAVEGTVDASRCERLEIEATVLRGVHIERGDELTIDVRACELRDCELSGQRFGAIANSRVVGSKLSGADFTSASLRDVVFDRCLMRLATLRMAELERVAFVDCTLEEVDLYDASLGDVSFDGSRLRSIDADQTRFHHVDLRAARELDFRACSRLSGCLLTAEQVIEMAYVLARVSGVAIERPSDQESDIVQT